MTELAWKKDNPTGAPPEVDQLIAELHANQYDERHLEWQVDFLMCEAVGLFRSEVVLNDLLYHPDEKISPELRAKREPFLKISIDLTRAERNKRLDQLWVLIGKLRPSV